MTTAANDDPVNDRIYIHELVEIAGHNRARYMHHITANWSPIGQVERGQLCFGVWGTVGSTGRWPEVINMWEHPGWPGMADNFEHEFEHPTMQDPSLAEWWAEAAAFRHGGSDRLLRPAPWSPTIDQLVADGVRGAVYAHELVQVRPRTSAQYLELVRDVAVAAMERFGMTPRGGLRDGDGQRLGVSGGVGLPDLAGLGSVRGRPPPRPGVDDVARPHRRRRGRLPPHAPGRRSVQSPCASGDNRG